MQATVIWTVCAVNTVRTIIWGRLGAFSGPGCRCFGHANSGGPSRQTRAFLAGGSAPRGGRTVRDRLSGSAVAILYATETGLATG